MADNTLNIKISAEIDSLKQQLSQAVGAMNAATDKMKSGFQSVSSASAGMGDSITSGVFKGVTASKLLDLAISGIRQSFQQLIDSTLNYEKASRTLQYATGNGVTGMIMARKVANDLGLEFETVAKSYATIAAAAKGTSLEGYQTERMFRAVARAAATLGMSADDTKGVLTALGQMISKGKVQAEELRGQLGERLPGAFQLAARAMGLTTAELDKQLKDGKVLATDLLPKLTRVLEQEFSPANRTAASSLQASINRVKNAWTDFYLAIGQSGVTEVMTKTLSTFAKAINDFVKNGGLQTIIDLLKSKVLWVAATVLALYTFRTSILSLLGPLQSLGDAFRVQMHLAAMQGVTGIRAVIGSLASFINPVTLAIAAVAGLAFAWERLATAKDRARERAVAEIPAQVGEIQRTQTLANEYDKLVEKYNKAGTSAKEKTNIQHDLKIVLNELISISPEYAKRLSTETGKLIDQSAAIRQVITDSINLAKLKKSNIENELRLAEIEAKRVRESKQSYYSPSAARTGNDPFERWNLALTMAEEKVIAIKQDLAKVNSQLAILEAPAKPTPTTAKPTPDQKSKSDALDQAELRLEALRLQGMEKITLEEQKQYEIQQMSLKIEAERERLVKITKDKNATGEDKKRASEQLIRLDQIEKDNLAQIEEKFKNKILEINEKLQTDLTGQQEGGLAKRLADVQKHFDQLRKLQAQLGADSKVSGADIDAAQRAAEGRARIAQIKDDVSKLKTELADLAQVKGRALSSAEIQAYLDTWIQKGGTAADAAQKVGFELGVTRTATDGLRTGFDMFFNTSANRFTLWKDTVLDILKGIESGFTTLFSSVFTRGMTGAQKWDAAYKSLANSVVQALSKMAAQELISWGISKAKFAWDKVKAAWDTANTTKTVAEAGIKTTANTTEAGSSIFAAAAGFFKAHSLIPWVGFAIAAGFVLAMTGALDKIRGRAVGGLVTSPELTLLGEKGPEVVAPEKDFKDWARTFAAQGASIAMEIAGSRNLSNRYGYQAGSYAAGVPTGSGVAATAPVYQFNFSGTPLMTRRDIEDAVHQAHQGYAKRNG